MARPRKQGLDYFPFDIDFFSDKKIKILKARYGADGTTLYIYLLCEIYKNGYYLKFDKDYEYIISDDLNMNCDKVKQVLNFLLERSLFDDKLFQSDKVLTSTGIQKRFQEAVKSRAVKTPIEISKFWILSKEETQNYIKVDHFSNSSNNNVGYSKNNESNSKNYDTKKSKVKNSKVNNINNNVQNDCTTSVSKGDINNFFESVWKLYPSKKGKGRVSDAKKKMLYELGYDTIAKCIDRYKAELEKDKDWRKLQNGSTFFNSGYIDYLDENYVPGKRIKKADSNSFNDFEQRNYTKQNMDDLEKKLLRGQKWLTKEKVNSEELRF